MSELKVYAYDYFNDGDIINVSKLFVRDSSKIDKIVDNNTMVFIIFKDSYTVIPKVYFRKLEYGNQTIDGLMDSKNKTYTNIKIYAEDKETKKSKLVTFLADDGNNKKRTFPIDIDFTYANLNLIRLKLSCGKIINIDRKNYNKIEYHEYSKNSNGGIKHTYTLFKYVKPDDLII